jgi:hypothetical protein
MVVLLGCATVWCSSTTTAEHWHTEDLVMSDWWVITMAVTAAMLIGKALSWLQTLLGVG